MHGNVYNISQATKDLTQFAKTTEALEQYIAKHFTYPQNFVPFFEKGELPPVVKRRHMMTAEERIADPFAAEVFKHELGIYVKKQTMLKQCYFICLLCFSLSFSPAI